MRLEYLDYPRLLNGLTVSSTGCCGCISLFIDLVMRCSQKLLKERVSMYQYNELAMIGLEMYSMTRDLKIVSKSPIA